MADADDRAAKAARAKAMLKKRQQQKATSSGSLALSRTGVISPTASTAPSEVPDNRSDAGVDITVPPPQPPRAATPQSPAQPSLPTRDDTELRNLVRDQQQTINLLVSEKKSLNASLERLQSAEAEATQSKQALEDARAEIEVLIARNDTADEKVKKLGQQLDTAKVQREQDYERIREQDRELETSKRATTDLRTQHSQLQRRFQDLEDQIQADDRVENLEKSLKGAQDRADSLESHLSKLRQTHATLKSERDGFESELNAHAVATDEWKTKYTSLEREHGVTKEKLDVALSERDHAVSSRDVLQREVSVGQKSVEELQRRLTDAMVDLAAKNRELQVAHADRQRADDLQKENVALVTQLEEMRQKTIELTGAKLALGETIETLQRRIRSQEDQIAQQDILIQDLHAQITDANARYSVLDTARAADQQAFHDERDEAQRIIADLQKELSGAHAVVRDLDAERSAHRQTVARSQEEASRLTVDAQRRAAEAATAQSELEEQRRAREESDALLHNMQTDVETLRSEVLLREEEVARLRQDLASAGGEAASAPATQTLDGEMLQALRQQHALDMSEAHTTIRTLEAKTFDAQAEAHRLQRRVGALEEELQLARAPRISRPSSALGSSAASVRARSPPLPLGQHILRPAIIPDDQLTPETRHKRRVSLSMLKARMDSEIGLVHGHSTLRRNLSNLSALTEGHLESDELPAAEEQDAYVHVTRRPQFLDESHVFWCSACRGDLVVL